MHQAEELNSAGAFLAYLKNLYLPPSSYHSETLKLCKISITCFSSFSVNPSSGASAIKEIPPE